MTNLERFLNSEFFKKWPYRDCWFSDSPFPKNFVDCFIPDQQPGPSDVDQKIIKDPPGLYYKHLSPKIARGVFDSAQSLVVGMKDGELYSASLLVHPETERMTGKTPPDRVKEYYLPFVQSLSGVEFSLDTILELYQFALIGDFGWSTSCYRWVAMVQKWDGHRDCNIHVVEAFMRG
jgi:hypothetical protein